MEQIKLVVLDVDDTLLTNDLRITEYTEQVLTNCQRKGVRVVLASGRPKAALMQFSQQLNLAENGGYIISYNGAIITDCEAGKDVSQTVLEPADVDLLLDIHAKSDMWIHTYIGDEIITPEMNEYTDFEGELTSIPVRKVDDFKAAITHQPVKILMLQEPTKLKAFSETIKPMVQDHVMMNISKPFFLEFTNKLVDKSRSISLVCEYMGISLKNVMAIGDSYNDLTMIRDAGFGVAMENAPDDVKKYAKYITHSNDRDGVATAINRFALGI